MENDAAQLPPKAFRAPNPQLLEAILVGNHEYAGGRSDSLDKPSTARFFGGRNGEWGKRKDAKRIEFQDTRFWIVCEKRKNVFDGKPRTPIDDDFIG